MSATLVETVDESVDLPVIELVHPMPGFPDRRQFALVTLDDDSLLCALRSLDDPELRFLVVPPAPFFPDYAPEVGDSVVSELEIGSAEEALVLLVLKAGDSLAATTANLLAPVVVNRRTRRAAQVILDDPTLSVSAPLVA
ncbi:MAG TPA: flagellar assembly protein FliW [Nocardioides sp.]|jgi:flagellar assembly factor FliW|uniref:flagellar assembly protein FliW n=1 Tax=Nocardioides sp. TaxID=35761 RepID=UPI002B7F9EA3|nr:flagellar assembly protein FliW [Nocardioides sp.]HTW13748.1 flagellar assembly protein FliW [Nocardioides sp.]